ncbi:MAG: hypothetical protein QXI58_04355 [Candidatus Micrarchaeia archaeon]
MKKIVFFIFSLSLVVLFLPIVFSSITINCGRNNACPIGRECQCIIRGCSSGYLNIYKRSDCSGFADSQKIISNGEATIKISEKSYLKVQCDDNSQSSCQSVEVTTSTTTTTSTTEKSVEIELKKGWNLISTPFKSPKIDTNCEYKRLYHWNGKKWTTVRYMKNMKVGKGYWVEVEKDCKVKFSGTTVAEISHIKNLNAGWNHIGSPYDGFNLEEGVGNCKIISCLGNKCGALYWNSSTQEWEVTTSLEKGKAYFINVESSCTLR